MACKQRNIDYYDAKLSCLAAACHPMKTILASTLILLSASVGLVLPTEAAPKPNPGVPKQPPAVRPSQRLAGTNSGNFSVSVATRTATSPFTTRQTTTGKASTNP
jgi:hypothetical protein